MLHQPGCSKYSIRSLPKSASRKLTVTDRYSGHYVSFALAAFAPSRLRGGFLRTTAKAQRREVPVFRVVRLLIAMASNKHCLLILMILPAVVFQAGCKLKDEARRFFLREEYRTAAIQIGDKTYTLADLNRFFDSRLSEFRDPENADKIKSNLLDSFIDEKLLLLRAEQKNVQASPQMVKAMMDRIIATGPDDQGRRSDAGRSADFERGVAESIKMQGYLNEYLLKGLTVSPQECEAYYKAHVGEYVKNDVVRVREILVDDPALAAKILTLLKAKSNKNFGDLARVYSKGASAADGGDLGMFQRGELPEQFEKAVFPLSPGSVSKIVRTQYGYHIFLVEEKIPAHQQRLIEVMDQIKEKLRLEREREIINKELESLRKEIPVVVHRELLDFKYLGTRYRSPEGNSR